MFQIIESSHWNERAFGQLSLLYKKSIRANVQGFRQDLENQMQIIDFVKSVVDGGGMFFGGFLDSELIGMLGLLPVGNDLEVCKFHIDERFQMNGYGKKLLQYAMDKAREYGAFQLKLHVSKTQERALDLYIKNGFEITEQKDCEVLIRGEIVIFPTIFMKKSLKKEKL